MSDHQVMESEGPAASNWLWALVAAVVGAIGARWLGEVGIAPALLFGAVVFVVYAVLLAQFWEPAPSADHDHGHGHGHDDHGHADHGHADHGHPAPAAAPQAADHGADVQPQALSGPRDGKADALQEIEGIGPALEKLCHDLGIYHFDQIAGWSAAEIAWMDGNLKGFKGRVTRDKWVAQARLIVTEGVAAFRVRAKTNDY